MNRLTLHFYERRCYEHTELGAVSTAFTFDKYIQSPRNTENDPVFTVILNFQH